MKRLHAPRLSPSPMTNAVLLAVLANTIVMAVEHHGQVLRDAELQGVQGPDRLRLGQAHIGVLNNLVKLGPAGAQRLGDERREHTRQVHKWQVGQLRQALGGAPLIGGRLTSEGGPQAEA